MKWTGLAIVGQALHAPVEAGEGWFASLSYRDVPPPPILP